MSLFGDGEQLKFQKQMVHGLRGAGIGDWGGTIICVVISETAKMSNMEYM